MARRGKLKMLTAKAREFDPNFVDRLSKNFTFAWVILERRAALEAHCGGDLSYVQKSLVKRVLWLECIAESYEQRFATGEVIDVGALTQLNNSLKGLYKDLGIRATARRVPSLREYAATLDRTEQPTPASDGGVAP